MTTEIILEVNSKFRDGKFTKLDLEKYGGQTIAPGYTTKELIEDSLTIGNVHWDGDILKLGDKNQSSSAINNVWQNGS